jgi:hypothetical protein
MSSYELAHNHHCPIPRMALEFDPAQVGEQSEFSLRVVKSDLENAAALKPTLEYMPAARDASPLEVVFDTVQQNEGGKLESWEDEDAVTVNFGFTPLPASSKWPDDSSLSHFEKFMATQLPRREHNKGRTSILKGLARITNLQYQYVVPPEAYDATQSPAVARFSYRDGEEVQEPLIVVSSLFDEVMESIPKDQSEQLTADAATYLRFLDPANEDQKEDWEVLSCATIPGVSSQQLFGSGGSSVGRRGGKLSVEDIEAINMKRDYRLQPGDQYLAIGHNLDTVSSPQFIAMVALGSINRLCRETHVVGNS